MGGNDDTLNTLSCLDQAYSVDCTRQSLKDDGFYALYDSESDISFIRDKLITGLSSSDIIYDYFDINNDTRSYRDVPSNSEFTQFDYYKDDFHIYADNRKAIDGGVAYAQLFHEKANGDIWASTIGMRNLHISTPISPVPAPSSFSLFLLAITIILGINTVIIRIKSQFC